MPRLPIAVRLESEQIEWLKTQAPTITEAVEKIVNNAIIGENTTKKDFDIQFDIPEQLLNDVHELKNELFPNFSLSTMAITALRAFVIDRKEPQDTPEQTDEKIEDLISEIEALKAEIAEKDGETENKELLSLKYDLELCKEANNDLKKINESLNKNVFDLEQRIGMAIDYSEYAQKVENGLKHVANEVERITSNWSFKIITVAKSEELFNIGFDGES